MLVIGIFFVVRNEGRHSYAVYLRGEIRLQRVADEGPYPSLLLKRHRDRGSWRESLLIPGQESPGRSTDARIFDIEAFCVTVTVLCLVKPIETKKKTV